jgi:hypothetical protein
MLVRLVHGAPIWAWGFIGTSSVGAGWEGMSSTVFVGCDTVRFIERSDDNLIKFPERECIEKALKNTSNVEFESHKSGRLSNQYYSYWIIDGSERFIATISLHRERQGNLRYVNSFGTLNQPLSDYEKKFMPTVLEKVDANIRKTCGVEIHSSLSISDY